MIHKRARRLYRGRGVRLCTHLGTTSCTVKVRFIEIDATGKAAEIEAAGLFGILLSTKILHEIDAIVDLDAGIFVVENHVALLACRAH